MKGSKILDFIFGYETADDSFRESKIGTLGKNFSDTLIGGIGSTYSKRILKSAPMRAFSAITKWLACASTRFWGIIMMTFGLMTLLINFADYYFQSRPTSPAFELIVGISFLVLSIPFLLVDRPLVMLLQSISVTDALLFEILCLRRVRGAPGQHMHRATFWIVSVVSGTALAVLGFFLPLDAVLISLGCLLFFILAMSSPEFSFMMTVFSIPVMPLIPHTSIVLACLVGITMISFLSKVLLGKRLLHIEQYDVLLVLFMIFTLISGIFNKGFDSFEAALVMVILSFAYFLASNIIVNRRLADNTVNLIITSSVPTAIYGIITYFVTEARPGWLDPSFEGTISSRATATFGNPNIFAVFLTVTTLLSLGFACSHGRRSKRPLYIIAFIINATALTLTFTRGAWIAVLLSSLAYLVIRSRRAPKILLPLILAVPQLIYLIPESVIQRFLSAFNLGDSSISYRISIWRSSIRMFGENIFIGCGVGPSCFNDEFAKYAENGVVSPQHSHNLFLEIGCELGIFALLLFVFIMLTRIRHRATYARYVRVSSLKTLSITSGIVTFAMLAFGMTDYVWYSSSMYYLFWLIFGLGSAALRISKREHDEHVLFNEADNSPYSAVSKIYIENHN